MRRSSTLLLPFMWVLGCAANPNAEAPAPLADAATAPPPTHVAAAPPPAFVYPAHYRLLGKSELAARKAAVAERLPTGQLELKLFPTGLVADVMLTGEWARPSDPKDRFFFSEEEVARWKTFFERHAELFGLEVGAFELVPNVARHGFAVDAGPGREHAVEVHRGSYTPLGDERVVYVSNMSAFPSVFAPVATVPRERALDGLVGVEYEVRASYVYAGPHCNGCGGAAPAKERRPERRRSEARHYRIDERVVGVCRDDRTIEVRRVYLPRFDPRSPADVGSDGWREVLTWQLVTSSPGAQSPASQTKMIDAVTGEDLSGRVWKTSLRFTAECPAPVSPAAAAR